MAFGFPQTFNPYPPQPQQMPGRYVEVVPVDNAEAAANFPVSVGGTQMMLARDDSFIAVKSVSINGQATLDIYDKRPPAPPEPQFKPGDYVRKDEIEALITAALEARGGQHEPV